MTTDAAPQVADGSPAQFTHRQIMVTMSGLVIAMLLAMLDNMIVAPALPTIVGDLNHLAWVTTGYVLASTASTPIWGKLGDLFGRRITFISSVWWSAGSPWRSSPAAPERRGSTGSARGCSRCGSPRSS
ncbi:MFS transporter [Amycolatopsis sp.]|uniref:MFS transporter n=1 Tax=Amycolatopsis sp. TaxID=37632 RepID=UPI0026199AEF|nr:MFS transporter [Amycolatopsis sp.]